MSNVAKLKKQAAEFELKKQFDKALAIYVKMLEAFEQNADELDVALFNRVGDLMLRQGNVADAVDYYEKAVDHYADTGFFNNAIALCNKILRHSPGRASVYYKLGKISAQKGFRNDAKVNFLEYADRMQKAGKVDEAFRALTEFADLCPDQDEIRLMLADQLTKADRKADAIEQLQILHERYDSEGRVGEAAATASRMRSINPSVEPRAAAGRSRKSTSGDLIFIDLDTPSPTSRTPRGTTPPATVPSVRPVTPPPVDIPEPPVALGTDSMLDTPPGIELDDPLGEKTGMPGSRIADDSLLIHKSTPSASLLGLQSTSLSDMRSVTPPHALAGLEATRLDDEITGVRSATPAAPLSDVEPTSLSGDMPAVATPPRGTPVQGTPVHGTPIHGTPVRGTPVYGGTPAAAAPAMPTPVEPQLAAATPSETSESIDDVLDEALDATFDSTFDSTFDDPIAEMDEPLAAADERPLTPFQGAPSVDSATMMSDELDLILPDSIVTPEESLESIDLDLSAMVTPASSPPPPRAASPTPSTTRAALEGLPLMDLEVPTATPPAPRLSQPITLPSTGELELVEPGTPPAMPVSRPTPVRPATPTPSLGFEIDLESMTIDGERISMPTPSSTRKSTLVAAQSVGILKASVDDEPENWGLRRALAEAMLEAGDRQGGIAELELAMAGAERSRDLELASSLAEEIARLEPDSVKHHQKRVEFAFLTNDRSRLIEAYVSLADALLAGEHADKARVVYQRVLDLAPDDIRARGGLESIPVAEPEAPSPAARATASTQRRASAAPAMPEPVAQSSNDSFVNLGDWLRDSEGPKDTRMVVDEQEPTGDEEADFADMLRKFKQGVAENVDAEDYQSHYDLAIAFKEMGLIDEAIAEFQKALGSPTNRLPTYEALGQCFIDKSQFKLALSILGRALNEKATEEQLVGVLYLLGRASEAQGNVPDALDYYQRVFVLDIRFRDIADRMNALERAAR